MPDLELLHHAPATPRGAPPLLFVHGVCHGAWCWEKHWLPHFAAHGHDSWALSLRGHGGSEGRQRLDQFTLDDYVDDVLQAVQRIGGKPVLIGHSMGGGIVQKAMLKAPELIAGAVLLASMPPGWLRWWETLRMMLRVRAVRASGPLMQGRTPTAADVQRMLFFSNRIDRASAERWRALLQPESQSVLREIPRFTTPPGPPKVPLFVIGSSQDALFGTHVQQRIAAHYRTTTTVLKQGCHDLMLDPDWRSSADLVLGWLAALPASPTKSFQTELETSR